MRLILWFSDIKELKSLINGDAEDERKKNVILKWRKENTMVSKAKIAFWVAHCSRWRRLHASFSKKNYLFSSHLPSTSRTEHWLISIAVRLMWFSLNVERARVHLNLGTVYRGQYSWGFWCASFDAPCKSLQTSIELHHQRRVHSTAIEWRRQEDNTDMHGTLNELWRWITMFEIDSNGSTETRKSTQANCEANTIIIAMGRKVMKLVDETKLTTKYLAIKHNKSKNNNKSSCI